MASAHDLRDYQKDAIDNLRASLRSGKRKPVLQMPTGAGKTATAGAIINMALEKGHKVIFCVPAISLVNQTVESFERDGIFDIGVMQAYHERTDHTAQVQVASIQTLMRRNVPDAGLVIIDEAHVQFQFYKKWFAELSEKKIPVIGLTATPWSKGMGKLYDDLIIGTTTQHLIDSGYLSPFRVFAPAHPDLTGVKIVKGDYETKGLSRAMQQGTLVADIVSTWLEKGENRPTLCFGVDRAHAKKLQQQFLEAGVAADYMDAFTEVDEREEIAARFANGETKVVCNVGVLTTGIDWDVRCIILARPTRSEILFTQIIGRGLRTAPGKQDCLILDHSDTTLRLGFVTDINHATLDDGEKAKAATEKKQLLPKACSKCAFIKPLRTQKCPACGFVAEFMSKIETERGELSELTKDGKQLAKSWTREQKRVFYAELLGHAQIKGYQPGWAYHAYRQRIGVGPADRPAPMPPSAATLSWIRHLNIFKAKQREKAQKNELQGRGSSSTRSVA
jgi:superfamily II DNA or RNA helicase